MVFTGYYAELQVGTGTLPFLYYSRTTFIQAVWDQRVPEFWTGPYLRNVWYKAVKPAEARFVRFHARIWINCWGKIGTLSRIRGPDTSAPLECCHINLVKAGFV